MAEQPKQMRFTEEELVLIRNTFSGNDKLLKVLRKVFLPEYDPYAPLGQVIDLWMTIDVRGLDPQTAFARILARNELISHVEQQLIQLNVLAGQNEETEAEMKERNKKDSTK